MCLQALRSHSSYRNTAHSTAFHHYAALLFQSAPRRLNRHVWPHPQVQNALHAELLLAGAVTRRRGGVRVDRAPEAADTTGLRAVLV